MDMTELDERCQLLASKYDPDEIVELLSLSSDDLVELLRSYLANIDDETFEEWME